MEFTGIGASEGTVSGTALVFRHNAEQNGREQGTLGFDAAMKKFYEGRRLVHEELISMAAEAEKKFGGDKAGIFEGYAEILMDDEIENLVSAFVKEGCTPAIAAGKAFEQQAMELEALEGGYMRERGTDLADIGRRLGTVIRGGTGPSIPVLKEPCIIVADELSPFETVRLDTELVLGLALDSGGYTGHVAILARSLGIPCAVALGNASAETQNGSLCAIDGTCGRFFTDPDGETLAVLRQKEEKRQEHLAVLEKSAAAPACTRDGTAILVCANIGSAAEAEKAAAQGADGVGLFRTEFLFMDSKRLPSEDEQFEAYRQAIEALGDKPLTIRTLDIGGDKDHPALALERETNPFLGYRAIRLGLGEPKLFKTQLRAVLRAAAFGRAELMFPLVVSPDEFRQARSLAEECRAELASGGIEAGRLPLGIMVETPAAALMAKEFAAEADFFSIGTNDLAQYTLAADRGNPRVAGLYDPLNPAVLRLMALACEAAAGAKIPVGICGELAADPQALPLLIGLGMTKLSVAASRIAGLKAEIRALAREKCVSLARQAVTLPSADAVRKLLSSL